MPPDEPTPGEQPPFEPSTSHLDGIGPPVSTPETAVAPLSDETVAAFEARATEAAIQTDIRRQLLATLLPLGDAVVRKFLGL